MAQRRNFVRAGGRLIGALAAFMLAAPVAEADRGRDPVWLGNISEKAPVEAAPLQSVRLALSDPARPTFDLRSARRLLLAQLPTEEEDLVPEFRPLGETRSIPAQEDPESDVEAIEIEDFDSDVDSNVDDIDPLEAINRPIFEANLFLDRWFLRPVTRVYIETVPQPGRRGVSNFLQNLRSPVILFNDFLQGEMSRAGATFGRFFINTFFGFAGLVDTADALGLPGHEEDFGQTLGSYGVGDQPYLMLPLIGPSNPRDLVGRVGDIIMDPLTYLTPDELSEIETGINTVSDRADVIGDTDTLEATSIDYYAAVRSFYFQNRDFEISNGRKEAPAPDELEDVDELYDGLDDEDLESLDQDLQLQ